MESHRVRSAQEVFAHHLQAFGQGLDALVSDYTEESSILHQSGKIAGLAAIGQFFEAFLRDIQPGFWEAFKIQRQEVCADVAYLVWEAKPFITMATDTLLVRDGKIHIQTFTALG
ncbi:MAG: nuclear transport factor 2 family protein [Comamonadaceae bacterium]|nr:MAG: nuclear transport factor 2 family protein [Comamonadaceae bacterium]